MTLSVEFRGDLNPLLTSYSIIKIKPLRIEIREPTIDNVLKGVARDMFIEPYFKRKGKSCKDYFLSIVSTSSLDVLNEIGVPYVKNVTMEDSLGFPQFTETNEEPDDIVLELCLEKDNIPLVWTNSIYNEVATWLISDSFEKFEPYDDLDYFYYFKCTKIVKKFDFKRRGVIEVTFKPMVNYAFKYVEIEKRVKGKEFIDIYNESDSEYEPVIVVENFGTKKTLNKINNLELIGLEEHEVATIDNYMLTVQNQNNENIISKCNREWIVLNKKENQLVIEGNCKVRIICEFPSII